MYSKLTTRALYIWFEQTTGFTANDVCITLKFDSEMMWLFANPTQKNYCTETSINLNFPEKYYFSTFRVTLQFQL